jgi:hypothetical protein
MKMALLRTHNALIARGQGTKTIVAIALAKTLFGLLVTVQAMNRTQPFQMYFSINQVIHVYKITTQRQSIFNRG